MYKNLLEANRGLNEPPQPPPSPPLPTCLEVCAMTYGVLLSFMQTDKGQCSMKNLETSVIILNQDFNI